MEIEDKKEETSILDIPSVVVAKILNLLGVRDVRNFCLAHPYLLSFETTRMYKSPSIFAADGESELISLLALTEKNAIFRLRTLKFDFATNEVLEQLAKMGNTLENLQSLSLYGCGATLRMNFVKPFTKLTNLEMLCIGSSLREPEILSTMSTLQSLTLHTFSGIDEYESQILPPQLLSLSLGSYRSLGNVNCISPCSVLESLTLTRYDGTTLNFLAHVPKLTRLEILNLTMCKMVHGVGPISKLVNLKSLTLKHHTDRFDISGLTSLAQLEELNLESCANLVNTREILQLPKLTSLVLHVKYQLIQMMAMNRKLQEMLRINDAPAPGARRKEMPEGPIDPVQLATLLINVRLMSIFLILP